MKDGAEKHDDYLMFPTKFPVHDFKFFRSKWNGKLIYRNAASKYNWTTNKQTLQISLRDWIARQGVAWWDQRNSNKNSDFHSHIFLQEVSRERRQGKIRELSRLYPWSITILRRRCTSTVPCKLVDRVADVQPAGLLQTRAGFRSLTFCFSRYQVPREGSLQRNPHSHKLFIGKNCSDELDPHVVEVSHQNNFTATWVWMQQLGNSWLTLLV